MTETDAPHTDDIAVERFAIAMKAKLAKKRGEGFGGWDNADECSIEHLSRLLTHHVAKGDPVDVANLAMMIHQRGGSIIATPSSTREPTLYGPYGYLNGCRTLPEDTWTLENVPDESDSEHFSIPLFAKVDVSLPVSVVAPTPQPMAVKALEWVPDWGGSDDDIPEWRAKTPFGSLSASVAGYRDAAGNRYERHADIPPELKNKLIAEREARYQDQIRSALLPVEAGTGKAVVPEGWQLVPKEPTEDIKDAYFKAHEGRFASPKPDEVYRAMLVASPKPPIASPSPSVSEMEALRRENGELRKIISDSAASLPNGAFIDPGCSLEFMRGLPKEISLVCAGLFPKKSSP